MLPITAPITRPITGPITSPDTDDAIAALFANGEPGAAHVVGDFARYTAPGPELVTNGGFSSDTAWTLLAGSTISGGALNIVAPGAAVAAAQQTFSWVSGRYYLISFSVTGSGTGVSVNIPSQSGTVRTAPGTYSEVMLAGIAGPLVVSHRGATGWTGTVDNVSVRELTAIDSATMLGSTSEFVPITSVEQQVAVILDTKQGIRYSTLLAPIDQFAFNGYGTTPPTATSSATTFLGQPCVSATFPAIASGAFLTCRADATGGAAQYNFTPGMFRASYTIALSRPLVGSEAIRVYTTGAMGLARVDLDASTGPTAWTTFVTPSFANATGANYLAVLPIRTDTPITIYIRRYGIEQMAGAHAIQPTAGSRAWLRNRYNQITYSDDFSNAQWAKSFAGTGIAPVVTTNAGIAPDGTMTADRIQFDCTDTSTSANRSYVAQNTTFPNGTSVSSDIWLRAYDSGSVGQTVRVAFEGFGNPVIHTLSLTWTKISGSGVTTGLCNLLFETRGQNTGRTADALVWGADVRRTIDTVYPYQWIRSATDYDSDPLRFPVYLEADGVATSMYTPANLDLSSTDKVTMFSAITKLGTADGMLLETSADAGANSGAFYFGGPLASGAWQYAGLSRGTTNGVATVTAGYASPVTNVVTMSADISGDSTQVRLNGSVAATASTDQGTGNFGSYPLYLFARAGTSLFFRGRFYASVIRGALTPVSRAAAVEQQLNVQALGKVY